MTTPTPTPLIVTMTKARAARLAKSNKPTIPIRLKVIGSKDEVVAVLANPFVSDPQESPQESPQSGEGFDIGKAVKSIGKTVKNAGPVGEAMVAIGAATGQPEISALGATTIAASKLAGGKKKPPPTMKAGRYSIMKKP